MIYKNGLLFLLLFVMACLGNAQIIPAPGARLNYTQVMFEYEKIKGAAVYLLQVAEDGNDTSFNNCLVAQYDSATATLVKNLQFGKKYKWRYTGLVNGKEPVWHGPYRFETEEEVLFKKKLLNITVTTNDSTANAGGLIVNDATHTAIDRNGKTVWFLPKIPWSFDVVKKPVIPNAPQSKQEIEIKPAVLDLRITPYGTVTYLTDSSLTETDLAGKILWKKHASPPVSDIGEEYYNHVFFRMPNGHYIALGREQWRKMPPDCDFELRTKYPNKKVFNGVKYGAVEFGTIIEYDKKGKVFWSWNSQDYLDKDPLTAMNPDPQFNFVLQAHANALSVDAKNEFVYMGFRDIDRIIKIEKKTGKVVNSWGPWWPLGGGPLNPLNLHKQHDAAILNNGNMAVFNNNDYMNGDSIPAIVIFSQQPGHDGEVIWKYDYDLDSVGRRKGRSGGNVDQLKNGNLLVCTGTVGSIIEITMAKRIVWQANVLFNDVWGYKYDWRLYRAHYISSLYPCYFTYQTNADTISKTDAQLDIKIFNKGSESDAYQIKILSPSGQVLWQVITDTVSANHSAIKGIQSFKPRNGEHKIEVVVSSLTNPDLERKSWVILRD
jgi:Arylsulfotransferase (ASST)